MRTIRSIKNTFLLLLASLLGSCSMLVEDLSECNLFLTFRYDYNLAYEDWFGQQVEQVRVFVFDPQGRYVQTITETSSALNQPNYSMQIPYHFKGYTMVVWSGKIEESYALTPMEVGDPIEKLTVSYEPKNHISRSHLATKWHSGPHTMEFLEANGTQQTVSLTRNTNDIYIAVNDGSEATTDQFDLMLSSANGSYDYRNSFLDHNPIITYQPILELDGQQDADRASGQLLTPQISTIRLVKGTPLLFSARDKLSGKNILIEGKTEVDLTELLLKGKPETMGEQEYLDRRYTWDIKLNYDPQRFMAISITINDWTHWFHDIEL